MEGVGNPSAPPPLFSNQRDAAASLVIQRDERCDEWCDERCDENDERDADGSN